MTEYPPLGGRPCLQFLTPSMEGNRKKMPPAGAIGEHPPAQRSSDRRDGECRLLLHVQQGRAHRRHRPHRGAGRGRSSAWMGAEPHPLATGAALGADLRDGARLHCPLAAGAAFLSNCSMARRSASSSSSTGDSERAGATTRRDSTSGARSSQSKEAKEDIADGERRDEARVKYGGGERRKRPGNTRR